MNERNDGEIIFNILDKIICGYANILKWHRQCICKETHNILNGELTILVTELQHEKSGFLHMRKQS